MPNIADTSMNPPAPDPRITRHGISGPLICFSHLRWDFVFQRPQHLMTRFADSQQVYFFEEPHIAEGGGAPKLRIDRSRNVIVLTPLLPDALTARQTETCLRDMLDAFVASENIQRPILWYYTPMMLPFSRHLDAAAVVYDCMDDLSGFRFAPAELPRLEQELIERADLVFTGGHSLYEAKKHLHRAIYPFPSSIDYAHFAQARDTKIEPADQRSLPGPRLGFFGVIDERMDLELVRALAEAHPEWSLVFLGPTVKIDPADLPRRPNIYYLGARPYAELPRYLSGWDVALMPFARNEATRFISPTKTPEYLAGGCPVVSTAIRDVEHTYGGLEGVHIAQDSRDFIAACEAAMRLTRGPARWRDEADRLLASMSWDDTYARMANLIQTAVQTRETPAPTLIRRPPAYDYLIVGAGFAGAVFAERLAADAGKRVLVIDRRPHLGGNAYDHHDDAGILVHKYGPHIFHTNSDEVFAYLSRFTRWREYTHRVLVNLGDRLAPMPINRTTLNIVYGLDLRTDADAKAFLASRAEPVADINTSEDVVVSAVGRDLYNRFFRGYTRKQWGMDPSELDKAVAARVPARFDTDDRYFLDKHQAMPANGYTAMFAAMLNHPNITVQTGLGFAEARRAVRYDRLIYSGPIDEYFGCRFGPLPYRSLRFEHQTLDRPQLQPAAVVNYPDEATPFTRITEYKHLTGQVHDKTSVTYEYPQAEGDPYYPVPTAANQALFKRYEGLARAEAGTTFVGRLATYRYYNMDQVVGQALATYRKMFAPERPALSAFPVLQASA